MPVSIGELVLIFVVALIVVGPKKLPELARMLGKGLAEFRRASAELRGSLEREMQNIEHEVRQQELAKTQGTTPAVSAPVSYAASAPLGEAPPAASGQLGAGEPELHAGLTPAMTAEMTEEEMREHGVHEPDPYTAHYHDHYDPEAPHEFQR